MACQVPRFQPLPQSVTTGNNWAENIANFKKLWTNTAQLINDTKAKEDEVDERIDSFEITVGGDFATVNFRLDATESDIVGIFDASALLELRVANNEGDIAAAGLTIATHSTDIGNNASAIAILETRADGFDGDFAAANLTIAANTSGIFDTNTALALLDTRVGTAEGDIASANLTLSSHTSSIISLDGTVASHTSSIATLTSSVSTAQGTANSALTVASTATSVNNSQDTTLASHTSSIATLTTNVSTAQGTASSALSLASTNSGDISTLVAKAYLVASTTVGGYTRIAGIKATAYASTTNLAFVGDQMQWLDNAGSVGLSFSGGGNYFLADANFVFHGDVTLGILGSTTQAYFGTRISPGSVSNDGTVWRFGTGFTVGYYKAANRAVFSSPFGKAELTCQQLLELRSSSDDIEITTGSTSKFVTINSGSNANPVATFGQSSSRNRLHMPNGYGYFAHNSTAVGALYADQLGSYTYSAVFRHGAVNKAGVDSTGAFITISDIGSKEVQSTELSALSSLNALGKKGYIKYKLKDKDKKPQGKTIIGLSSADIEEHFPELVSEMQDEGDTTVIKGVNYAGLTAPILVALAEITDRLEALEAKSKKP